MKEVDIRQYWRCIYTYMFVCLFVTHIYVLVLSANICVFVQRMFAWNGVNGRMRRKWTHTWEKTHRAEKIASLRGKKPHVYILS